MSKFEKFFASGKVMNASFVLALYLFAMAIVFAVCFTTDFSIGNSFIWTIIMILCTIFLYAAYRTHASAAMHTAVGALLLMFIVASIELAISQITALTVISGWSFNVALVYIILNLATVVLFVLLLINHCIINSAHKSASKPVIANEVIVILIIIFQIAAAVILFSFSLNFYTLMVMIAKVFVINMIVCIESKLNVYKLLREKNTEEGTWTPEKKEQTKKEIFND